MILEAREKLPRDKVVFMSVKSLFNLFCLQLALTNWFPSGVHHVERTCAEKIDDYWLLHDGVCFAESLPLPCRLQKVLYSSVLVDK